MASKKTRRKGSASHPKEIESRARANGAPPVPEPAGADPSGALRNATTVLGGALGGGYTGARAVTAALAPDAMSAALLVCMPDEWTEDGEAQGLIHRLSNDEAAIVLAWLATQWRDGYSAAVVDLRAGRRPLTELGQ